MEGRRFSIEGQGERQRGKKGEEEYFGERSFRSIPYKPKTRLIRSRLYAA